MYRKNETVRGYCGSNHKPSKLLFTPSTDQMRHLVRTKATVLPTFHFPFSQNVSEVTGLRHSRTISKNTG